MTRKRDILALLTGLLLAAIIAAGLTACPEDNGGAADCDCPDCELPHAFERVFTFELAEASKPVTVIDMRDNPTAQLPAEIIEKLKEALLIIEEGIPISPSGKERFDLIVSERGLVIQIKDGDASCAIVNNGTISFGVEHLSSASDFEVLAGNILAAFMNKTMAKLDNTRGAARMAMGNAADNKNKRSYV